MPRYTRREFLKNVGLALGLGGLSGISLPRAFAQPKQPNVLLIICDQMHAGMLSCTGNPWVKTPALDKLASQGTRFERAYAANPVCVPSRFTMMTGVMPSRIGMESNDQLGNPVPPTLAAHALGRVFADAGYDTAYGGKTHVPRVPGQGQQVMEGYGFSQYLTADQRAKLAETCADYLKTKRDKPFLLVASFINPHDICYMAIAAHARSQGQEIQVPEPLTEALAIPPGVTREEFFARLCPPVPPNYEIPQHEPDALLSPDAREFRRYVRQNWTDEDWRLHRWAYARLTERVDAEIGVVLQALADAGLEDDTLVVFLSDHGDMDAAHRLEHKSVLYEESVRVPLIVRLPGLVPQGAVDREHLVSTGLDLIPSLCDLAGIPVPEALAGRSIRPLVTAQTAPEWRTSLAVETANARLMHQGTWKYVVYGSGDLREQVVDLTTDPGEMRNLAVEPAGADKLQTGRRLLREWYATHGETLDPRYVIEAK